MKIISILRDLSTGLVSRHDVIETNAEWMRDPLAHPAIDAMSERELADLPFNRLQRRGQAGGSCLA